MDARRGLSALYCQCFITGRDTLHDRSQRRLIDGCVCSLGSGFPSGRLSGEAALVVLVAVVLATIGAYLLSTARQFNVHAGDALELVGALFWSVHVVLLGKFAFRF